ncbi:threalose-6-phosphate phosphatase [Chytridiales sp. JEL 0842]|nr:threalose-6-phosphate phosphatase [Chytridiales sp. JEL 0842]
MYLNGSSTAAALHEGKQQNQSEILTPPPKRWNLQPRYGNSALYSGIRSLRENEDEHLLHIGWPGAITESSTQKPVGWAQVGSADRQELVKELKTHQCVPVWLDDKVASGGYDGYCKTDLWPLFHYILWDSVTDGSLESKNWADYVAMNKAFADSVVTNYQPGDTIWIHDYHLLLLPAILRERLPEATIGFFLHTPFPSSEIFRCLPKRKEILQGILGANVVGFQTYSYARHFISSCTRVLGLESSPNGVDYRGNQVVVGIFPIGIDVAHVEAMQKTQAVQDKIASIRETYAGKYLIIGRDKLDHINGVHHKLNAFEKFLALYPEWQNKVVLIQVTSPAQRECPKLESKISEIVSRINGTFGSLEFVPVHHYHHHLDPAEYLALLSVAHVGLITSVRDGMNTTSHEFVVCQQENRGALILSEFTGTAGSLSSAILVNPWDYLGVANAINEALLMSAEDKLVRHQQLYKYVTSRTVQNWARSFVMELRQRAAVPDVSNPTPRLDRELILRYYKNAKKRLLLFDYDGTLTPIVKTPSAAVPPPRMLKFLATLCADPRNYVFVISGRDQACLDNWLGHIKGLGLSAEHGSFIKYPGGQWTNLSKEMDLSWKDKVAEVFQYYTERTQGSFVEHKRCSITWHYRLADPDYGSFQARECHNHLENAVLSKLPVEVMIGKKNLEVRPRAINKGEIVKKLLAGRPGTDFIFCVGDDSTDEEMFKSLRRSAEVDKDACFTCMVGSSTKKTKALWHVESPEQVIDLMGVWAVRTNLTGV